MWLWQSLKASVYDPVFYRSMKDRRTGPALGYFAVIVFVASLIVSFPALRGISSFVFYPSDEVNSIKQQALDLYPDWLELKAEGGKLSMNAESPFAIPMPHGTIEGGDQSLPTNLIVINTERPIEVADFEAYDTLIVLGADEIGVIEEKKGKTQIQKIGQFLEDGKFDLAKDEYVKFVNRIEKMIKGFGIVLLFLVPIAVFSGLFVSYLVYLLFGALVIWFAAWARKTHWQYGTAYKAGLYLITLPIAYNALSSFCTTSEVRVPFFFTILLFVIALINISSEKPAVTEPVADPVTPVAAVPEASTAPAVPAADAPAVSVKSE
jgi:hypothetical protein